MAQSNATWQENAARWKEFYPSSALQAEFFLLKFGKDGDLVRQEVLALCEQFNKFDKRKQGELEEDEAMMLLEARDSTKTFVELRAMVADIDLDKNRKLSFLEWACAIYKKSWMVLHSPSVDPREIEAAKKLQEQAAAALAEAAEELRKFTEAAEYAKVCADAADQNNAAAQERKRQFEADMKAKAEAYEAKKKADAEERERLTSQSGVKGSAARFHYAAKDTADTTGDNASRLKAEAAARKETKRLAEEKAKAEAEAAVKAEELAKAAELQRKADEENARKAEEARVAEEARKKAEEGSGTSEAERKAYEEQKAALEAEEAAKKAEEARKRAEGRARLAEKSGLWNNGPK